MRSGVRMCRNPALLDAGTVWAGSGGLGRGGYQLPPPPPPAPPPTPPPPKPPPKPPPPLDDGAVAADVVDVSNSGAMYAYARPAVSGAIDAAETARCQRSISPTATAHAVYSRSTPRLAASSAWYASELARKRRNDSTRSHAAEPAGVRTRSSQARRAAASPAPATTPPSAASASQAGPRWLARAPPAAAPSAPATTPMMPSTRAVTLRVPPLGSHMPLVSRHASSWPWRLLHARAKFES